MIDDETLIIDGGLVALFICHLLVNSFACCEAPGDFGDGSETPQVWGVALGAFHPTRMDQNGLKIHGGLLGFFVCWKQRTSIPYNGTPHISIISFQNERN